MHMLGSSLSHFSIVLAREQLFGMINELSTCYEIVSGKAGPPAGPPKGKKRAAAGPNATPPRPKQYKQVRRAALLPQSSCRNSDWAPVLWGWGPRPLHVDESERPCRSWWRLSLTHLGTAAGLPAVALR